MLVTTTTLILLASTAGTKQATPETPPGRVCRAEKGPHPKKDVEIQPVCEPTPKPGPTPKPAPKRRSKEQE